MSDGEATSDSGLSTSDLEGVTRQLAERDVTTAGELTARLITGGRSNLTYVVEDSEHRWVLRRPPTAGATPSAHDVAREFRVTSALHEVGVPVPTPVLLCEDIAVLGAPFTVVDFVDGASVQDRDDLEELDDVTISALVENLVRTLAHLHEVDHVAAGLESYGKSGGYAARQLRRWSSQWDIVGEGHDDARAPLLAERLGANLPDQDRSCVVHGDYRSDNTLVDLSDGGKVRAIVDWELSTIGDPVADVATMCAYRHPAFDLVVGFPAAWTSDRLPDATRLAEQYARASGSTLPNWEFHTALAYYKLAVIAAGIDHRYRAGGTVGDGFDHAGQAVDELIEAGLDALVDA